MRSHVITLSISTDGWRCGHCQYLLHINNNWCCRLFSMLLRASRPSCRRCFACRLLVSDTESTTCQP